MPSPMCRRAHRRRGPPPTRIAAAARAATWFGYPSKRPESDMTLPRTRACRHASVTGGARGAFGSSDQGVGRNGLGADIAAGEGHGRCREGAKRGSEQRLWSVIEIGESEDGRDAPKRKRDVQGKRGLG